MLSTISFFTFFYFIFSKYKNIIQFHFQPPTCLNRLNIDINKYYSIILFHTYLFLNNILQILKIGRFPPNFHTTMKCLEEWKRNRFNKLWKYIYICSYVYIYIQYLRYRRTRWTCWCNTTNMCWPFVAP